MLTAPARSTGGGKENDRSVRYTKGRKCFYSTARPGVPDPPVRIIMAKARVHRPTPPPVKVFMELTEAEADFLLGIMGHIGGDPTRSPRKYAERIRHALGQALKLDYAETDANKLLFGFGSLLFENYDKLER